MHVFALPFVLTAIAIAQQAPTSPKVPGEPSTATTSWAEVPVPESAHRMVQTVGGGMQALPNPAAVQELGLDRVANAVLFDAPEPGQLWASAPTWKAGFDGSAATFVPFFGSDAPNNVPARFAVAMVHVAGESLTVKPGIPRRDGDIVAIHRGAMIEQYVTSLAGIEQRFVFEALPQRGELVVAIAVDADYEITAADGVHTFRHALGSFEYGTAFAFDRDGRGTKVTVTHSAGELLLTVPAEFVATAALPLVIDPLIGNSRTVGSSSVHHGAVDLAFDASRNEYLICFERRFSGADSDVLGVRCDVDMQPIGTQFFIDLSTTSWRGCRVAGLDLYDKFLVVCECEQQGQPTYVGARIYDAGNGTIAAPIDIERGAVACRHPDVGGDPLPSGPVFWTVVYERAPSSTNHDIVFRQVQSGGTLRGTTFTAIDTSPAFEHSPVISKSDGRDGTAATQRWCIAYRRDDTNNGSGITSVRTALVLWDGAIDPTRTSWGTENAADSFDLAIAGPTVDANGRRFLLVQQRLHALTRNHEILGAVVGANGALSTNWQVLLNYTVNGWAPAVACDGTRFALAYTTTPPNVDIEVALFDLVGGTFRRHDSVRATTAPTLDGIPAIVSHASGGATSSGDRQYGAVWNAAGTTSDTVVATRYRGMAATGGASTRWNGCGNVPLSFPNAVDFGALGTTIEATVQNQSGTVIWGIGLPTSVPLPGCGTCVVGTSAMVTMAGSTVQVAVPYDGALVGFELAFQAFSIGQGTCLGTLALSDTMDVRIR